VIVAVYFVPQRWRIFNAIKTKTKAGGAIEMNKKKKT